MNFFDTFQGEIADFKSFFKSNKVVHVLKNKDGIDPDTYYRKLSSECGIPLIHDENPSTGELEIGKWSVIEYNPSKDDTYKYSNTAQPLHIDYSYFSFDIYAAFIFCVKQAEFGGATHFIDADVIAQILELTNKKLLLQLQNTLVSFGRDGNPIGNRKDYILQQDELGWKINWNYYRAMSDKENLQLVEDFKDFLETYIQKSGELKEIKLQPGEAVFFHDKRVLHGRNSFIGSRHLNKGGIAETVPDVVKQLIEKT